jgi:chromosome segregation ATPase
MKNIGENFEDDIKIDRYKLDRECQEHALRFLFYSDKLAEAKTAFSEAEDSYKLIRAQRELDYRQMADLPGGMKKVEASYALLVEDDEAVIASKKQVTQAKKALNTYEAAVRSLEHRKNQLDSLVRLWCAGYYANPGENKRDADKLNRSREALNHPKDSE